MNNRKRKYLVFAYLCLFFIGNDYGNTIDTVSNNKEFNDKVLILKNSTNFIEAQSICDELDSITNSNYSIELEGVANIQRLIIYSKFHKYVDGISLALLLEQKITANFNFLHCTNKKFLYRQLSDYMMVINNNRKSIYYLHKLQNQACYSPGIYSLTNYKLAENYLNINQNDSAQLLLTKYIDSSITNNDSATLIGAYNQYGLIARQLKQYKQSISSFEKAIYIIEKTGHRKQLKPILFGNIGHIYKELGDYTKALYFLNLDSKGSISHNTKTAYFNSEIKIAEIEIIQFSYKSAINRMELLLRTYEGQISLNEKKRIYNHLSQATEKINLTSKSLFYLRKYSIIKDSLNFKEKSQYQSLLNEYSNIIYAKAIKEHNQQIEMNKKDLVLLNNQKKISNQQNNFYIFLLLLIILIIFFISKRIIDIKKRKSIHINNKLRIREQDLKLRSTEKKLLQLQIVDDNKQINSLALELNLKSNFSDSLMTKLKEFDSLSFAELRQIELFVQNELELKSNRAKLQKDIESIGTLFFNALFKKHPELNDPDIKLCSLIVLNLSNKEIAINKNIATNSVKISKNRLKKKLNIDTNTDLKEYLKQFL